MFTNDFFVTTVDGLKISVQYVTPNKEAALPTVLLLHGYSSDKNGSTRRFVSLLAEQGIASVRFDFRGCGDSEGRLEDETVTTGQLDAQAVLHWIQGNPQVGKLGILGSSYGGLNAALLLEAHPSVFSAGVLNAPATDWAAAKRFVIGDDGIKQWQEQGMYTLRYGNTFVDTPYSFYEDIAKYDVYRDAGQIDCPILILHGDADKNVPVEQSEKLAPLIPQATLHILPGADHGFPKPSDFDAYVQEATAFLGRLLNI